MNNPLRPKSERHIHCFATSAGIGGMQRWLVSLTRQCLLRSIGISLRLAATPDPAAAVAWFERQGVKALVDAAVPSAHQPQNLHTMRAFIDLLRHIPPGIVNLHYGVGHISLKEVLAVRLAGRRCVAAVHAASPWSESGVGARASTRRAARLCRTVIVHSQATCEHLLEAGIPPHKIQVIPCGVPAPTVLPSRACARLQFDLQPETFVVATAARLVHTKGIDDLITAVAELPDGPHGVRLLIAGEGPARKELEALAARLLGPRALFLGQTADVNPVYAAADVFALPSHMEGLGLVFLEAAHHKVPSVGTRVGGIPEAILEGETGLLTPVQDSQALALALERLREDPDLRHKMGEAAQRRVREEFSESAMAERYLRALQR